MMKKIFLLCLLYAGLLLLPQNGFAQFKIPPIPKFQTSLYDYADLLSADEKVQLEEKLVRYSDTTSTQIVIATVQNLNGDSAQRVAPEWAQNWGIGQKGKDNGIFILVSKDDRDMYIATGYGVQGRLTAGQVGTIVRRVITPEFKNGDYYGGLDKGSDAIFQALNGKFKGERKQDSDNGFLGFLPLIVIIFIIIIVIISRKGGGGGGGGRRGGLDLTDILILSSLGSGGRSSGGWGGGSSGGWSGGGGGGFGGGFGGGGFSGGGAGGSW